MSFSRSRSPQRARAFTTLPSFPYGPPNYIVPVYVSNDIPQLPYSIPRNTAPQRNFPQIFDARSLLHAVHTDPELIFQKLHQIIQERDHLREEKEQLLNEVRNIKSDYEGAKLDYASARGKYEVLGEIATAKQMLLWRFIERLKSGEGKFEMDEKGGGGNWIPNRPEKELGIDVKMGKGRRVHNDICCDGEQDGRNWMMQSPKTANSETISLNEGSTVSAGESRESGDSSGPKLDPSAIPFIPSPKKSFTDPVRSTKDFPNQHNNASNRYKGQSNNISPSRDQGNSTGFPNQGNRTTSYVDEYNGSTPTSFYGDNNKNQTYPQSNGNNAPVWRMNPGRKSPSKHQGKKGHSSHRGKGSYNYKNTSTPAPTPAPAQSLSQGIRRIAALPIGTPPSKKTPTPSSPSMHPEILKEALSFLPSPFDTICPFSLLESGTCTIPNCVLSQLCSTYNELAEGCKMQGCEYIHMYRSCIEEIDFEVCHWWSVADGKAKRKMHFRSRVHGKTVVAGEWRARVQSAALRKEHREGRWGVRKGSA